MKKPVSALLRAISLAALALEPADYKIFRQICPFIYDQNGQPTSSENAVAGKHYMITSLNFTAETKYEFTLVIQSAIPGHREGLFSTAASSYSRFPTGRRKSFALSM